MNPKKIKEPIRRCHLTSSIREEEGSSGNPSFLTLSPSCFPFSLFLSFLSSSSSSSFLFFLSYHCTVSPSMVSLPWSPAGGMRPVGFIFFLSLYLV